MASGPGSLWVVKSNPCYLHVSRGAPPRYLLMFSNIFTLLAPAQSADKLFHMFIILCEKEYFLISNLHCSFTKATLCSLIIKKKRYLCQYFHNHSISLKHESGLYCHQTTPQGLKFKERCEYLYYYITKL